MFLGANPQGIRSYEPTVKGKNNLGKLKSDLVDPVEPLNTKNKNPKS